MPVLLFTTQTLLYCPLLRFIQWSIGKADIRLGLWQVGPLQRLEIVARKEDLSYEGAGEKYIPTLESVQDKTRAGTFGLGERFFTDSDDRRDFRRCNNLGVRNDFNGSTTSFPHVSFDFAMVGT